MQTYEVQWTYSAKDDLRDIIEYIKRDSITTAKAIFDAIRKSCDTLCTCPERARVVPELQEIGIQRYREILYKRWRIIFKIEASTVTVLLVIDSRRNLEDLLFQKLLSRRDDTISDTALDAVKGIFQEIENPIGQKKIRSEEGSISC